MNICIISCLFPPEPVVSAKISYALADELSKTDSVDVFCPPPSRPNGFNFNNTKFNGVDLNSKIKIIRSHSMVYPKSNAFGRLLEGISFGIESYKHIKRERSKYSIVYANTWPIFGQFGVAYACKKYNIPYVIHIQDIYPESLSNKLPFLASFLIKFILLPFEKFNLRNAFRVIVVSNNMKTTILSRKENKVEDIVKVNNWQDDHGVIEPTVLQNQQFTFMYLGNIGPVANLSYIIKVFCSLDIDAELIIAGSGSKREECEILVSKFNARNVKFLDVPEGFVGIIQERADVLLLPTIKNGASSSIPSKLPSYMFSKKPILAIVDQGTDTYNTILDASCGWVVDPIDEKLLKESFNFIVKLDKNSLKKLGENGLNYALNHFSKDKNLNKIISILHQVENK